MHFPSLLSSAASVIALASFAAASDADTQTDVIALNTENFDAIVNPESLMLVQFCAPESARCGTLLEPYEDAARSLAERGIKLGKIDCSKDEKVCHDQDIKGFPTLKVYRNGKPYDYKGVPKPEANGIIEHMEKLTSPPTTVLTAKNHPEFQKSEKMVVVGYFESLTDPAAAEFSEVAEQFRGDFPFGIVTDPKVIASSEVKPPAYVVYRSYDDPRVEHPKPAGANSTIIGEWIKTLNLPVIGEISGENFGDYVTNGKPLGYIFLDPSEGKDEIIGSLRHVAANLKDRMNFVWIDATKFGEHAKALVLKQKKWPSFVIQELTLQLKFPLDQLKPVTPNSVAEWSQLVLDGKVEPTIKSGPIPETQDDNVYNLVADEFTKVALDNKKNVFLQVYAPRCDKCDKLNPIWTSLADHYAGLKDRIVIAKMDASENDIPLNVPFHVTGFPSLKFKPAGEKEFVDYEGDSTLDDLTAFVGKIAKNVVEVEEQKSEEKVSVSGDSASPANATNPDHKRDEL